MYFCCAGNDPSCWCEAAAQQDVCYSAQREKKPADFSISNPKQLSNVVAVLKYNSKL